MCGLACCSHSFSFHRKNSDIGWHAYTCLVCFSFDRRRQYRNPKAKSTQADGMHTLNILEERFTYTVKPNHA